MSRVHSVLRYKLNGSSRVRQVTAQDTADARQDARDWLRRQPEGSVTDTDLRVYDKAEWDAAKANAPGAGLPLCLYRGEVR